MTVRYSIPSDRFQPRWYQLPFIQHFTGNGHDGSGKVGVEVMHRRGGKDVEGMAVIDVCAWRRVGMYWHTFPTFEQGRKAIWEGFTAEGDRIIDLIFPAEQIRARDNQQMRIELKNGSIYRLVGTDKIEAVGAGPVGVLHSEYSIAKPKAADLIAPMLRENNGWEAYVYTPRGNNHGKKLFDRIQALAKQDPAKYYCALQTLYDTRAYDPDATIAEERARGRPEALIRQEYLCDWTAANVGAVWGDLLEALEKRGGISAFDHPTDGVFTVWDLGVSDATALWFFRRGKDGWDVIDHYEASGQPLSHFCDVIEAKPYTYLRHFLPHDARARTLQTGVSTVELLAQRFGTDKLAMVPNLSFADGIQAARWALQQPMRFHARCADGIEALRAYHYAWDEDRKVFSTKPEHDWSSHPADAFRYFACALRASDQLSRKPDTGPRKLPPPKAPTLDEVWDEDDRQSRRR